MFAGDNIKDGRGELAIFDELGSVPTSMFACSMRAARAPVRVTAI